MSKEELSFEELPDGSKIITIQGINQFGEKYIRQERIKCPSVWDALKRLTYTADDMEAFAEWASNEGWQYLWYYKCWQNNTSIYQKTTAKLREMWEQSRKEATE